MPREREGVRWKGEMPRYSYIAKTQYRKFETNIPRKEIVGLRPNFHIHVCASY